MPARFVTVDRATPFLLPPALQEWLPEDHLARFVVEIVDRLDLSRLEAEYAGRGSAAYHPAMLTALLLYGYATGTFSSRKLEAASYDSIAVRFICANTHPDHDTIATFRRRFLRRIEELFVQVLLIAREMGVLKLGTVSLDGTKIKANASKHKALSYAHAQKLEQQLRSEIAALLKMAEEADQNDAAQQVDFPAEIQRRENRLEAIAKAKATIEQRAADKAAEQKAAEQKAAEQKAGDQKTAEPQHQHSTPETDATSRLHDPDEPGDHRDDDRGGSDHGNGDHGNGDHGNGDQQGATATPKPKDQVNLTDEESRIMPRSGGGFVQAYNAQALVDVDSKLVIGSFLTQAANDKQQVEPALKKLQDLPEELGRADVLLGDNGYLSEANVELIAAAEITAVLALGRQQHNVPLEQRVQPPPEPPGDDASAMTRMRYLFATPEGRSLYGKRKSSVEPVFGIAKHVLGFRQFSLRGLRWVAAEWTLVSSALNLRRLFKLAKG